MSHNTLTQQHIHKICDKIRQLPLQNQKTVYRIVREVDPKVRVRIQPNHVSVVMTDCNLTTLHIIEKYIDSLVVKRDRSDVLVLGTDSDSDTVTNIIVDMKNTIDDCDIGGSLQFSKKEKQIILEKMRDDYLFNFSDDIVYQ